MDKSKYQLQGGNSKSFQNYNAAVNLSDQTIYTYMGILKPRLGNVNYCSAGQISPLLTEPVAPLGICCSSGTVGHSHLSDLELMTKFCFFLKGPLRKLPNLSPEVLGN
jgi:hypothetical protein